MNPMNEMIDIAIENVLAMVRANSRPDEALKFTQAALNLSHAKQLLELKVQRTKGASA